MEPCGKTADEKTSIPSCVSNKLIITSIILSFMLYLNTLNAGFVYDDWPTIIRNEDVSSSESWMNLFYNDFWGTPLSHIGSHKSYRPICTFTFKLNYLIGGLDPFGYHLFNIACHCTCSAIYAYLCIFLFRETIPAVVSAILFAVHPIHAEAVAGIVGRADLLAALFFLLSFALYLRHINVRDWHANAECLRAQSQHQQSSSKWLYLIASSACAVFSTLSKENGISAFFICAIYDLTHSMITPRMRDDPMVRNLRELWDSILTITLVFCLVLAFRLKILQSKFPSFSSSDNPAANCDDFVTRLLTFLYLPSLNFILLLYPMCLSFDWPIERIPLITNLFDSRNLVSLLFYASLFCFCLNIGPFSIHSTFLLPKQIIKTIKLHPPSLNDSIFNSANYRKQNLRNKLPFRYLRHNNKVKQDFDLFSYPYDWKKTGNERNADGNQCVKNKNVLVVSLLILVFSFLPAANLFYYVGFIVAERILYIPSMGYCMLIGIGVNKLIKKAEHSLLLKMCVYFCFLTCATLFCLRTIRRNEDWKDEESLYRSSLDYNSPKAFGNLGVIYSMRKNMKAAEWAYRRALSLRSNMADVHYNLGILLHQQGRLNEAFESYRMAVKFRPTLAHAFMAMATLLIQTDKKEISKRILQYCIEMDITRVKDRRLHLDAKISCAQQLSALCMEESNFEEAILYAQKGVMMKPFSTEVHKLYLVLGESYSALEEVHQAEKYFKLSLTSNMEYLPAYLSYINWLTTNSSRINEVETLFSGAEMKFPSESSLYHAYGNFLYDQLRFAEALEKYMIAVSLSPRDASLLFNIANVFKEIGQRNEAIQFYRKALKIEPNDASIYLNLGATLHLNGDLLEAEINYKKALSLRPNDKIILLNIENLHHLRERSGKRLESSVMHNCSSNA